LNITKSKKFILLIIALLIILTIVLITKGYNTGSAVDLDGGIADTVTIKSIDALSNISPKDHSSKSGDKFKVWEEREDKQFSLNELHGYEDVTQLKKENIEPSASVFEIITLNDKTPVLYIEFKEPNGNLIHEAQWAIKGPLNSEINKNGTYFVGYFTQGYSKDEVFEILNSIQYETKRSDNLTDIEQQQFNNLQK
jgi:hypothetical protein